MKTFKLRCVVCDTEFESKTKDRKTHSASCSALLAHQTMAKKREGVLDKVKGKGKDTTMVAGTKKRGEKIWQGILNEAFDGTSELDEYLATAIAKLRHVRFDVGGKVIDSKNWRFAQQEFRSLVKLFKERLEEKK